MQIIISTQKSKDIVSRLIRNEFDNYTKPYQHKEALEMIETAKMYGLQKLAEQMQIDLE